MRTYTWPGSDGAPAGRVRRFGSCPDAQPLRGAFAGATASGCRVLARALLRARCAQGRFGRTEAAASSGPVLLDQWRSRAQGAIKGRQFAVDWPARQAGRGRSHAWPGGGRHRCAHAAAANPGPKPLYAALVAGVGVVGDRGWEGWSNGERDRTRRPG